MTLEQKIKSTQSNSIFSCSQSIWHNAALFTKKQLDNWGIKHNVIDQRARQFVITFLQAYHQGFSSGFSIAEAVNYTGNDWNYSNYKACNSAFCPEHAITLDCLQPFFSAVTISPQNIHSHFFQIQNKL